MAYQDCYNAGPPQDGDDCCTLSGSSLSSSDCGRPGVNPTGPVELEEQSFLDRFKGLFKRGKSTDAMCMPVMQPHPCPQPVPVLPAAEPRMRTAYRKEFYQVQVPVKKRVKVPVQVKGYKKKHIYSKVNGFRTKWVKTTVPGTKTVKRVIKVPTKKTVMRDKKVTTYKCVTKVRKVPYQVFVEQRVVPAPINMCPEPEIPVETCPVQCPVQCPPAAPAPCPMPAPAPCPVAAPAPIPMAAPVEIPMAAPVEIPMAAPATCPMTTMPYEVETDVVDDCDVANCLGDFDNAAYETEEAGCPLGAGDEGDYYSVWGDYLDNFEYYPGY